MGREGRMVNVIASIDVREVTNGVRASPVFEEIGREGDDVAAEGV